jgi:hypothetical protein
MWEFFSTLTCTTKIWTVFGLGITIGSIAGVVIIALMIHTRDKGQDDAPTHLEESPNQNKEPMRIVPKHLN